MRQLVLIVLIVLLAALAAAVASPVPTTGQSRRRSARQPTTSPTSRALTVTPTFGPSSTSASNSSDSTDSTTPAVVNLVGNDLAVGSNLLLLLSGLVNPPPAGENNADYVAEATANGLLLSGAVMFRKAAQLQAPSSLGGKSASFSNPQVYNNILIGNIVSAAGFIVLLGATPPPASAPALSRVNGTTPTPASGSDGGAGQGSSQSLSSTGNLVGLASNVLLLAAVVSVPPPTEANSKEVAVYRTEVASVALLTAGSVLFSNAALSEQTGGGGNAGYVYVNNAVGDGLSLAAYLGGLAATIASMDPPPNPSLPPPLTGPVAPVAPVAPVVPVPPPLVRPRLAPAPLLLPVLPAVTLSPVMNTSVQTPSPSALQPTPSPSALQPSPSPSALQPSPSPTSQRPALVG